MARAASQDDRNISMGLGGLIQLCGFESLFHSRVPCYYFLKTFYRILSDSFGGVVTGLILMRNDCY